LTIGRYDVVITIGPSYSTQREEATAVILDLVKVLPPNVSMAVADILVKNLDVPGVDELVDRVKKLVPVGIRDPEPGEQPPQQQPDPEMMVKMQELQIKQREAMRKEFESQVKAIKDLAEAESKERGQQLEQYKVILDDIRSSMQQMTQPA
jgi:hypothetical protein